MPNNPISDNQRLVQLREDFRNGKKISAGSVRPLILASWERCRNAPGPGSQLIYAGEDALARALQMNAELIACATPVMARLRTCIHDAHSIIGLADSAGLILHTLGQPEDIAGLRVFQEGYYATEEATGTNGIGTGLIERKPIEVVGAEHYMNEATAWSCSSAPVFDDTALAGVLNISIRLEHRNYHTIGFVQTAAYAISEQIRLRKVLARQDAMLAALDEGVIITNAARNIVAISNRAESLLGLRRDLLGQPLAEAMQASSSLDELLADTHPVIDREISLGKNPSRYNVSSTPLPDGGKVLIFRPLKKMREYVNRLVHTAPDYSFEKILGNSDALQRVIRTGSQAARSDITTLIRGESGTGKELFAQSIHNASSRKDGPFVAVNCGAIPRELLESELFGYEEGAFTGARRQGKPGKFELADGGTLFLDEIGDLPLSAQVSLLRVLQENEIVRIGGNQPRRINIRILAATNRNLEEAVSSKSFRVDLYYRLNVLSITIPPLRDRESDILLLANAFLEKYAQVLGRQGVRLSDEVAAALQAYAWPGNVRELENVIERMVNIAESSLIQLSELPESIALANSGVRTPDPVVQPSMLRNLELETIASVLASTGGNMRQAAARLGLSRSSLYRKLKKSGLPPSNWREASC